MDMEGREHYLLGLMNKDVSFVDKNE